MALFVIVIFDVVFIFFVSPTLINEELTTIGFISVFVIFTVTFAYEGISF